MSKQLFGYTRPEPVIYPGYIMAFDVDGKIVIVVRASGDPALREIAMPADVARDLGGTLVHATLGRKKHSKLVQYVVNNLLALDQGINTLLGGDPDETISSRIGRRPNCPVCSWLCRMLDKLDPGHCKKAIEPFRYGRDILK